MDCRSPPASVSAPDPRIAVRNVQRIAAQTVAAVLSGRSLNHTLEAVWKGAHELTRAERGAIQDLCYGTLRHLGRLRAVLSRLATRQVDDPELQTLLLVALYQLEYSEAAPYAVVDHAVECAAQIGGGHVKAFVNAVLRNFQRGRAALLKEADSTDAGLYSYPAWWIERLRRDFPSDAHDILQAGNMHPPMTLRVNRRRATPQEYLQELERAGLDARMLDGGALTLLRPVPVEQLPGFGQGVVSVQDAGAQFAARLLDLDDGMRVLDACAAPGGKTAHMLELADLDMTALDADPARLTRVSSNLERLGLTARVACADAAAIQVWWDNRPYDRVLLDAPCTASGVVRRHPDIKWLRQAGDLRRFAEQQQCLLEALWKVLGRGGKLLYVTCSIFREENQERIGGFAARHPDARILGAMPGRGGLLLPDNEHDGFYYALLQKN
ncbi:MAG TPA: 16S rRNA (cytosine(967)-C(5))-methyltransferase RsmB [Burkholderiales bacterium]|nr:16S rRNA (cytosine(967)-C(5))-methyltransferase RsmB [Burkholderiales bacterium]